MIIEDKLLMKIIKNPSIESLPDLDEKKMHKYTLLAYKMKHGVQLNQKYSNMLIYMNQAQEKKGKVIKNKDKKR